jgi:hypothetical protein
MHIQSAYRDLRRRGVANDEAIRCAVAITGWPCLFTTLTTLLGLLSFNTASLESVRQLGTAGGLGIAGTWVTTYLLLPIVLSFNRRSRLGAPAAGRTAPVTALAQGLASLTRRRRRRAAFLALTSAITLAAAFTAYRRATLQYDRVAWLPQDVPTVVAFRMLDREVGGSATIHLLVEPRTQRGLKDLALLRQLERLDHSVRGFRHPSEGVIVTGSYSLLDVLRETRRALQGGDPRSYRLPDTQRGVDDTLVLFQSGAQQQLRRLVSPGFDRGQITYFVRWLDATEYDRLIEHLERAIREHIDPQLATIKPTGSVLISNRAAASITRELAWSFMTAFVTITAVMMLALLSVGYGLLSMVPNTLSILWVLGAVTALGFPLNMGNLMVGTIALGLVVNDTIHFFHHFRVHRRRGRTVDEAIALAVNQSGSAILLTNAMMAVAFLVFVNAQMAGLVSFGIIGCAIVVVAAGTDIALGAALLRVVSARRRTRRTLGSFTEVGR